ncbi:MAG: hypothetical protein U0P82_05945 [Vicinamibacterales bacterium]
MLPTDTNFVGETLSRRLHAFQRRVVILRFLDHLVALLAAALLTLAVVSLAAKPEPARAALWSGAAIVLASVAAAVLTSREGWSRARTAQMLDRRFRLFDRMTTAESCLGEASAPAALVVADAAAHLSRLRPSDVTPTFRLAPRWLGVAAIGFVLATLIAGRPTPDAPVPTVSNGAGSTGPDVEDASGQGTTPRSASATPSAAEAPTSRDASTPERSSPSSSERGASRASAAAIATATVPSAGTGTAGTRTQTSDARTSSTIALGTNEAVGRASSNGSNVRAAQPSTAARVSTDGVGNAGGGGASSGNTAGSGAGGAAETEAAPGARDGAPGTRRAAAASPLALVGAPDPESPTAQERVPPTRRAYVREYFAALRAGGNRQEAR